MATEANRSYSVGQSQGVSLVILPGTASEPSILILELILCQCPRLYRRSHVLAYI